VASTVCKCLWNSWRTG